MAKFEKGNPIGTQTRFSGAVAGEMQARSAAARKENHTLREVLLKALQEDAGNGMTRMEALARKALSNHYNGKLTLKDLRNLSAILGEDTLNIKTEGGPVQVVVGTPEAAEGLRHALQTGAQPAKPASEE